MKPIYQPSGKAKEYGDLALNIYTGCPHRCFYCFAPGVLRRDREQFHTNIQPRQNILQETEKQLKSQHITGQLIHLCFTCDPYPTGYDTTVTRQIIQLLKQYGNHVQILTKGDGGRDLDLLDHNDWYGVTIDGASPWDYYLPKINVIAEAKARGINTWCSYEPVVNAQNVLDCIEFFSARFDKIKIGKLNYHQSNINWAQFGRDAEALCKKFSLNYYIKDSLRKEMEEST